jgi:hypothetical protein
MNKHLVVSLAALAFTAGCSDLPMGPDARLESTPFSPAFTITQSGNGSAYHGYTAPALSWDGGKACAAWSDVLLVLDADHFSYEFEFDNDGTWELFEKVSTSTRHPVCTAAVLPDGDYRLTGMAKHGTGQETTTHHTNTRPFTVADVVYSFVRIAAGNDNTETAAPGPLGLSKTGSITFWAVLYKDGVRVNNCTTVPVGDASATITFTSPGSASSSHVADECAFNGSAERHRYKFTLTNHFNNQNGGGKIELKVGGNVVTTYNFTTS